MDHPGKPCTAAIHKCQSAVSVSDDNLQVVGCSHEYFSVSQKCNFTLLKDSLEATEKNEPLITPVALTVQKL